MLNNFIYTSMNVAFGELVDEKPTTDKVAVRDKPHELVGGGYNWSTTNTGVQRVSSNASAASNRPIAKRCGNKIHQARTAVVKINEKLTSVSENVNRNFVACAPRLFHRFHCFISLIRSSFSPLVVVIIVVICRRTTYYIFIQNKHETTLFFDSNVIKEYKKKKRWKIQWLLYSP